MGIPLGEGLAWVLIWVGFMLLYTLLDVVLWRKLPGVWGSLLHLTSILLCQGIYVKLLMRQTGFRPRLTENLSAGGLLLAAASAAAMYFLLDKGLDPLLDRIFPASQESYQERLAALSRRPWSSLVQVCIFAPFLEELLMRGFLLDGLMPVYGWAVALGVSAALFALLHFNAVQTLSALVCGVLLGALYMGTGSVACCMLAHMGYNLISYVTEIVPLMKKVG